MLTAADRARLILFRTRVAKLEFQTRVAKLEALDRQLPVEDDAVRAAPVVPPEPARPTVTRGSFMDYAREFPELHQFPESPLESAH